MPHRGRGGISFLSQIVLSLTCPHTPNLNPLFVGFSLEDCERGPLCRKLAQFTLLNLKKETAVKGVNRGKYPSLHLETLDVEITELCHLLRCSISCDLESNRNISCRLPKWRQAAFFFSWFNSLKGSVQGFPLLTHMEKK